jgi:tetratricopeptide (TPR) repeat protein
MPRLLHPLPTETLDAPQRRRRANIALRFLGAALRGDTHDHDAWPEWRDALPHVLHVVNLADQHGEGLPEAADLMDRLSVFHRVRGDDPAALTAAARALHLYERAHTPVPATYATYLTNHAMAVRAVEGAEAALKSIERALAIEVDEGGGVGRVEQGDQMNPADTEDTADTADQVNQAGRVGRVDQVGPANRADQADAPDAPDQVNRAGPAKQVNRLDADHAQTLNLYASILESAGRSQQADEAFRQALDIARHSHQDSGDEEDAETLVMVLNDYSVHLLHHAPEQGVSAKSQAAEVLRLLDEADTAGRTGGYGTEQIMLNRAEALRRLDRPEDATRVLEDLIALCEQWDEPTLLLFAALANLAEILATLGDPRHGEVLRRAHEIDDLLATS